MPNDPYNPLDRRRLGETLVRALEESKLFGLGPLSRFFGIGVYALYYRGAFPFYRKNVSPKKPIYIGKADPPGGRKGIELTGKETSRLYSRLAEHIESIRQASNLEIGDFDCRYLIVDPIWIPFLESLLIEKYRPIWNVKIEGFGIHHPGSGRKGQKKSVWDTIHPGRVFAEGLPSNEKAQKILAELSST